MQRLLTLFWLAVCAHVCVSCRGHDDLQTVTLTLSASNVGREGELLRAQLKRFEETQPGVSVKLEETPDAADQRHQLYVQWLNAKSRRPDVLQLDVIWTPEFAAAGWLLPVPDESLAPAEFFPATLRANRYQESLYAVPWFVDVGMLYYRKDLLKTPPGSLAEVAALAKAELDAKTVDYGLVWQNARYEGLITTFTEVLGAFGGRLMQPDGRIAVNSVPAKQALTFMQQLLREQVVPRQALGWQEEQTRFAFQNGKALFMRNWPYAAPLLAGSDSQVQGRFDVMPLPAAPGGSPTAALGGAQLAVNKHTRHPGVAQALVRFLTAPAQMRERALVLGQLPPRPALFDDPALSGAFGASARNMRRIISSAQPRPAHPLYTELSEVLQVELHRALSGQKSVDAALFAAQSKLREIQHASGLGKAPARRAHEPRSTPAWTAFGVAAGLLLLLAFGWRWLARRTRNDQPSHPDESTSAWWMLAPTLLVLGGVALLPLLATGWQSLFILDLRMPWKNTPEPTLDNYRALFAEPRLWGALGRTLLFIGMSVSLELVLGLALALALHRHTKLRALRTLILLPWAIPTVVAGLVFRFLFEGPEALANLALVESGLSSTPVSWLSEELLAWVPVILADVWKTTPFVTLLLLAALTNIDGRLYEAAKVDGALRLQQFFYITLPELRPTLLVVLLFRVLDALRVFDLIYVLTQGGPGTATEPLALYTFSTLFSHLKFGQGAALSVIIVALAAGFSLVFVTLLGRERTR